MSGATPTVGVPAEFESLLAAAQTHHGNVGLIASAWAVFELTIDTATLQLGRFDTRLGFCLTSQVIGPARKIDAYIAVARERGAKRYTNQLEKFAKKTAGLAELRNRMVHDPWIIDNISIPARLEVTAKRLLRIERVNVTIDDLVTLFYNIAKHTADFTDLHQTILDATDT